MDSVQNSLCWPLPGNNVADGPHGTVGARDVPGSKGLIPLPGQPAARACNPAIRLTKHGFHK